MQYPIFNSFINRIKADLNKKNIKSEEFVVWTEETINAIGLELRIQLDDISPYLQSVTINFDWDKFREVSLARQLPGMEKHPLLNVKNDITNTHLKPNMDVEVSWKFNQDYILEGRQIKRYQLAPGPGQFLDGFHEPAHRGGSACRLHYLALAY